MNILFDLDGTLKETNLMPETRVDSQCFKKFPSFRRGIVVARNMNNRGSFTQLESLLSEAIANAAADPIDLTTDPRAIGVFIVP